MLHILLLILKLIGIIIASILGIILLVLLLVLFVPIRYQMEGKWYDKLDADIKVGWLCRILYLRILYHEDNLIYRVRIFGINIKDSTRPEKEKKEKKKKRKKRVRKSKRNQESDTEDSKSTDVRQEVIESVESESKEFVEIEQPKQPIRIEDKSDNQSAATDKTGDIVNKIDNVNKINSDQKKDSDIKKDNDNKKESKTRKFNIIEKLKNIWTKIKNFFLGIPKFFRNLKNKFKNLMQKKENLFTKINTLKDFVSEEQNKAGFKGLLNYIWKLTKHILPRKVRGYVMFGTGDPCSTGQLLGVLALGLPYYKDSVRIVPNFEESMIEGELFLKGRIRLATLLIICIKILLDKRCRQLYNNYKILKEEL